VKVNVSSIASAAVLAEFVFLSAGTSTKFTMIANM